MIRLILNILWFILGGWLSGLLWLLGGAILALTVVGLPYTMAAWRIAGFSFWPFGKEVVSRESLGMSDAGTGGLGVVLNIIWFIFVSFAFIAYLMFMFNIIGDLFRDHTVSGWVKALWMICLIFAGWYIALSHLLIAVAEFVSIIGIPFALKDLQLAMLALAPVGKTVVEKP